MDRFAGRRKFLKASALTGLSLGIHSVFSQTQFSQFPLIKGKRVGIIGLDTSHSTAFTKALNQENAPAAFLGYRIVAAYPFGSRDIKSSAERIPGYTEEVKKLGVEIVNSIDELIQKTDVVLLETNDGRLHLEQVIPVLKAGKKVFIDKPMAASLSDTIAIFRASDLYRVPLFSASSLRFASGMKSVSKEGKIGKILGADAYSPMRFEPTHPDLFWYGIHGVETLFTLMGKGCETVIRNGSGYSELVTGIWKDQRVGTFRGLINGRQDYGATVFGEKGIEQVGKYEGYDALLSEIVQFFETGKAPVDRDETIEIFAFMEAADESKRKNGAPVSVSEILKKAMASIKQ